jgi:predicted transposase/invertase (TIGR01784 family)
MLRSINRMNDYAFKRIFGAEENKDILLHFLNSTFQSLHMELTDIELIDREIDPEYLGEKYSRLDILGRTHLGTLINIEVQIVNQYNMEKRTLFYWAKLYQGQLSSGQSHSLLKKTITVNIVNFICLPDETRYHNTFHIYEQETHHKLLDDLEIHFLELPKLLRTVTTPRTTLEKWLLYLNNLEGKEMEEIAMSEPMIRKALTCEEIFQKSAIERRRYELREKAMMEEQTLLHGAKAEGHAEGHAEGRTEGKLEGWKESIAMILESKFGAESIELRALLADITDDTRLKRMTPLILAAATTSEVVEIIKEAHTTNLE